MKTKLYDIYKKGRLSITCFLFGHVWEQPYGMRVAYCIRCGARASVRIEKEKTV